MECYEKADMCTTLAIFNDLHILFASPISTTYLQDLV